MQVFGSWHGVEQRNERQCVKEKFLDKAQFIVAQSYHYGEEGVVQNHGKAIDWYSRAVEQGYAEAELYLGHLYINGEGIAKNRQLGIKLVEKAATRGLDKAVKYLRVLNGD